MIHIMTYAVANSLKIMTRQRKFSIIEGDSPQKNDSITVNVLWIALPHFRSTVNWIVMHNQVSTDWRFCQSKIHNTRFFNLRYITSYRNFIFIFNFIKKKISSVRHPIFSLKIRLMFCHMSRYQTYVRGRFDSCHDKSHVTNHMFEES